MKQIYCCCYFAKSKSKQGQVCSENVHAALLASVMTSVSAPSVLGWHQGLPHPSGWLRSSVLWCRPSWLGRVPVKHVNGIDSRLTAPKLGYRAFRSELVRNKWTLISPDGAAGPIAEGGDRSQHLWSITFALWCYQAIILIPTTLWCHSWSSEEELRWPYWVKVSITCLRSAVLYI